MKMMFWGFSQHVLHQVVVLQHLKLAPVRFNQYSSSKNGKVDEISASGGYMLTQCSLPFASPGHMRGLVMQRLFKKILNNSPENVFLSSFNEHIGEGNLDFIAM